MAATISAISYVGWRRLPRSGMRWFVTGHTPCPMRRQKLDLTVRGREIVRKRRQRTEKWLKEILGDDYVAG